MCGASSRHCKVFALLVTDTDTDTELLASGLCGGLVAELMRVSAVILHRRGGRWECFGRVGAGQKCD